ncbi:hypothetical protein CIHG_06472 [Coccidioides immitis H538.4]|uniref:Uncharacterized protein n=3 Tax=Coccidioides immitis TaxID=5501 RepID=A0A0J8QW79_COCIT|nr:hypothetical protein CIRG_10284 [Coccidioides immitis RMSCC 2394]KMU76731.1 hypothetical protein CISG_05874 [Coccidioides immitis RMSCC 3703]KMU88804.1 hypothetical protein CIHG_06472 [Coccidioides immitis H538.4]
MTFTEYGVQSISNFCSSGNFPALSTRIKEPSALWWRANPPLTGWVAALAVPNGEFWPKGKACLGDRRQNGQSSRLSTHPPFLSLVGLWDWGIGHFLFSSPFWLPFASEPPHSTVSGELKWLSRSYRQSMENLRADGRSHAFDMLLGSPSTVPAQALHVKSPG